MPDSDPVSSAKRNLSRNGLRGDRFLRVLFSADLSSLDVLEGDFGTMTPESVLEGVIFRLAAIRRAGFRTELYPYATLREWCPTYLLTPGIAVPIIITYMNDCLR